MQETHPPSEPLPPLTVCHYSNNFLALSKTFIYNQIKSVTDVRHVVITRHVMNSDVYSFSPICCATKPDGGAVSPSERKAHWRQFLLSEDVRLIHAHFANSALDILSLAVELGLPMLVTLYGNDIHRMCTKPRFARDYPKLFKKADFFIAVSDDLRRAAIRAGFPSEKMRTSYLGAALERYSFRERTLGEGEPVRFLHLSNFVPKKGVPILIRAFQRVHAALPKSELLLAGYGAGVEECVKLVHELGLEGCVKFPGPIQPPEIPHLMDSAHIYVQPSITTPDGSAEGLPCVLAEAAAAGLLLIGTRHAGIPEIIRDGRTGVLVDERDEQGLADKMMGLATHPERWQALSRAALAHVRERFDLARQAAFLSAVYNDLALVSQRGRKRRVRTLITNTVPVNGGDEAILAAMLRDLKRETNSNVRVLANDVSRARALFPDLKLLPALEEAGLPEGEKPHYAPSRWWAFKMRIAARLMRTLGKCVIPLRGREAEVINAYNNGDVVVSAGGGYLTDNYVSLWNKLCGFDVAAILKKPLVIYAQSIGPFRTDEGRRAMCRVLRRAALVMVRDRSSFDEALTLGVAKDKLHLMADAGFALPVVVDGFPEEEISGAGKRALNVGMSVRTYEFPDRRSERNTLMAAYRKAMARLCEHLIARRGARLTFISTCQGIAGYADDSAVAAEIIADIQPELRAQITLERGHFDPLTLKRRLGRFDIFIGTRMHSIVLASLSHVPCCGIACEQKTEDLLADLGLRQFLLFAEDATPEKYIEVVNKLVDARAEVRRALEQRVPSLTRRAHQSAALLCELIERMAGSERPASAGAL